jgi:Helix-turn-helix domain
MPRSAPPLVVSPAEQIILEAVVASEEIPESVRKRARVVLLAADGAANCTIAREVSLARPRVVFWRQRFGEQGIRGLWDLEGVRPQDPIPEAAEQGIVIDCLYRPRLSGAVCVEQMLVDPSINWNVRNLAWAQRKHCWRSSGAFNCTMPTGEVSGGSQLGAPV